MDNYVELLAIVPCIFLLGGLLIAVGNDSYMRKDQKRTMLILIALVFTLVIQNMTDNRLAERELMVIPRTLAAIYGYSVRPVILLLFMQIIEPERDYRWARILAAVNAAVHMTALFSPVVFWFSEPNNYRGGLPILQDFCLIVSMIFLFRLFWMSYKRIRADKSNTRMLLYTVAVILLALLLDSNVGRTPQPVSFLTIAIVIDCALYYNWLHLQFVKEHEEDLKAEQRIKIMVSQIQPHFLFNTLMTIQSFCLTDPDKAFEVTERFGAYLRQNIDSLNQTELIPLEKELEHTRTYAEIEKIRFPEISVEYEILDDGYDIPVLTIQPMVENAIRHGVRIRDKGIVKVMTRRNGAYHEIVIADNGKGFDTEQIKHAEGTHIGIQNVQERIERMCGGTFTINSRQGEGTEVVIRTPAV